MSHTPPTPADLAAIHTAAQRAQARACHDNPGEFRELLAELAGADPDGRTTHTPRQTAPA